MSLKSRMQHVKAALLEKQLYRKMRLFRQRVASGELRLQEN